MRRLPCLILALASLSFACGRGEVRGLELSGGSGAPEDDGGSWFSDGGPWSWADGGGRFEVGVPGDGGRDAGRDSGVRDAGLRDGGVFVPDSGLFDAGSASCNIEEDCWRQLGAPPCNDGVMSRWRCVQGACLPECSAPVRCRNDCDCPDDLACSPRGVCAPLSSRRNECCLSSFCPPGASCVLPNGDPSTCPSAAPDGGVFDGGPGFDAGPAPEWVGRACGSQFECAPGFCIDEGSGFPGGYCSQECGPFGSLCPAGAYCQDFGDGQGLCLDVCGGNGDCRPGYRCTRLPFATERVCWPEGSGSTNPNGAPVGDPCGQVQDCNTGLTCFDQWPGGYCTRFYCDPQSNPCPGGSQCYAFPGAISLCLEDCPSGGSTQGCRPGYYCLGPTGQPGVCISN